MTTEGLRSFLQGDFFWILTTIAVFLSIKCWKNSNWLQLFSVIGFYTIIVSLTKGQQILKAFG